MNDNAPQPTHEVFGSFGTNRTKKLVGAALVLLVVFGVAAFTFMDSGTQGTLPQESVAQEQAPNEPPPPPRSYWYSDAPIADMTFGNFLGGEPKQTHAIAAHYLSSTLWKDQLNPVTNHDELRPYAEKLVAQTILLVASNTPLEKNISDVFAGIIEKPENRKLLAP